MTTKFKTRPAVKNLRAKAQSRKPNKIHLTEFQTFLLLSILKVVVVLVLTLMAVAYTVLLERKVLGRIQNRWGPSRVGPFGLLQPLVDGIKLFLKEDLHAAWPPSVRSSSSRPSSR